VLRQKNQIIHEIDYLKSATRDVQSDPRQRAIIKIANGNAIGRDANRSVAGAPRIIRYIAKSIIYQRSSAVARAAN
jgi:hypothetical protein